MHFNNNIDFLWQNETPHSNLVEFAARTCYNSMSKFQSNKNFLNALWKRGHYDVFEHVAKVFTLHNSDIDHLKDFHFNTNKFFTHKANGNFTDVCMNYRVFKDYLQYNDQTSSGMDDGLSRLDSEMTIGFGSQPINNATLLAYTSLKYNVGRVVFYLENVSRECLSQLRTHRLLSYSVMSQRYCGLDESNVYVPKSIAENKEAKAKFDSGILTSQLTYKYLRELGIKQQDARSVSTQAQTTNLVISGEYNGLEHLFNLRALDTAAQRHIRLLTQDMLQLCFEANLHKFDWQHKYYVENLDKLTK